MRRKILIIIIAAWVVPFAASAKEKIAKNDSTHAHAHHAKGIYQGTNIKLDLGATALTLGTTKANLQHYEIAVNCRLKNRFYPTLEVGYAGSLPATTNNPMRGTITLGDSIAYRGQGGFFRVGCDLNPLKKNPDSPHALLVGVRLGTSIQSAQHILLTTQHSPLTTQYSLLNTTSADCWGEIVAGCQVEVCKGFTMGWMGRFKCLFTRQAEGLPANEYKAIYIPGFGRRDNIAWGLDYYRVVSTEYKVQSCEYRVQKMIININMHKFRELIVWQRAMELARNIYSLTRSFPYTEQKGIISQLQRAAVSIAANIAEGAGRKTPKDFAHFLTQANGSAFEIETLLDISLSQNYLTQQEYDNIINQLEEIEKILYKMTNNLTPQDPNIKK